MRRRQLKEGFGPTQPYQSFVEDIREKDRERVAFLRQIGLIADQYVRQPILTKRFNRTGNRVQVFVSDESIRNAVIPFPRHWMDSILQVR